jgi:hypothetical protein
MTPKEAAHELMEALLLLQALKPETATHGGQSFDRAFAAAREVAAAAADAYVAAVTDEGS